MLENIPRMMFTHIPVEVEVRLSTRNTPRLAQNLLGPGLPIFHDVNVAEAMSLRLSAPRGGFLIDPQCPETQWVSGPEEEFATWRFTVTPVRRGSNVLRLTLSYQRVGPGGLIANSSFPDKTVDIIVKANVGKICTQAAVWTSTLVAGAALGAYFQPAIKFITTLYSTN
jgi:hypothetical protein